MSNSILNYNETTLPEKLPGQHPPVWMQTAIWTKLSSVWFFFPLLVLIWSIPLFLVWSLYVMRQSIRLWWDCWRLTGILKCFFIYSIFSFVAVLYAHTEFLGWECFRSRRSTLRIKAKTDDDGWIKLFLISITGFLQVK